MTRSRVFLCFRIRPRRVAATTGMSWGQVLTSYGEAWGHPRIAHAGRATLLAGLLAGCASGPADRPPAAIDPRTPLETGASSAARSPARSSPPAAVTTSRPAALAGTRPSAPEAGVAGPPVIPNQDQPAAGRAGAYYLDDGPGTVELPDPATIADAAPAMEPLHPRANRPYEVFGTAYVPQAERRPFVQRGVASWYGRKFQGKPTSTGEPYDMYAMTAAHPTLPLPSFVRVTNLDNGRVAIVRVNDRGPFLRGRAIDLSMIAAHKLGYLEAGSARVEVRVLDPEAGVAPARPAQAQARPQAQTQTQPPALALASTRDTAWAAPVSEPAPSLPGHHYVQLAAFSSLPAAEAGLGQMQSRFDWIDRPIRVIENASVFRLHAGPWPDHAAARAVASRIETETGLRPWIVARP